MPRGRQSGYALLVVVFFAAVMAIGASAVVLNVYTQGVREREEELIWRGQQYVRGVRLYFRKFGKFPQSTDDLVKHTNQVRFLRRPYKDPMNSEDGTWRFIYVAPTGQLIGSLTRTTAIRMPTLPQAGGQPGRPGGLPAVPGAPGGPLTPTTPGGPPAVPPPTTPVTPVEPATSLEGTVIGGNIIGVASKVRKPSLKVYEGGTTYRQWEFIWDPTQDVLGVGQPVSVPATPGSGPPSSVRPQPTPTPQPRRP